MNERTTDGRRPGRFEQRGSARVLTEDGWFVLNARDAPWLSAPGRGRICDFEGAIRFSQVGISLSVLAPGEPMAMYHWEADQEDFLVLSGEARLIIEGEERTLGPWDFVHCPAGAAHVIVGAGACTCVVLAIGAREHQAGEDWGAYTVDPAALRHGAGVSEATNQPETAYAALPRCEPVAVEPGWLPEPG